MPKVDLYQCDNNNCPEEAETRDLESGEWLVLNTHRPKTTKFFDTVKCLSAWLQYQEM